MIPLAFRKLESGDLDDVFDIDRSESIHRLYRQSGDELESYDNVLELTGEPAFWEERLPAWKEELDRGASAYGAYDAERMAGLAILKHGAEPGTDEILALYVSVEYRLSGVAKSLYLELERAARKSGARRLRVATTPTGSAVGFYLSQGFQAAPDASPTPEVATLREIPMVKQL